MDEVGNRLKSRTKAFFPAFFRPEATPRVEENGFKNLIHSQSGELDITTKKKTFVFAI